MKKHWLLLIPIGFMLDRAAKIWASRALMHMPGGVMPVLSGVLRLRYVENEGMAFSMLQGRAVLLSWLTAAILLGLLLYLLIDKRVGALFGVSLSIVVGGGLGNLYDRIAFGYVIDFIEPLLFSFAVFNLADVFVVCGAALSMIALLRTESGRKGT